MMYRDIFGSSQSKIERIMLKISQKSKKQYLEVSARKLKQFFDIKQEEQNMRKNEAYARIQRTWTLNDLNYSNTRRTSQIRRFKIIQLIMLQNLIGKKLKNFTLEPKTIGIGATGIVVLGRDLRNNQKVAVKVMLINPKNYQQVKSKALSEISMLTAIHNENVLKFVDSFETNQFFFIVTEYCNGGDLHEYLLSHDIDEQECVVLLKHILNGFKGLHEAGIMHRDLKTANILLHDGVCKIGDFGLSKRMGLGDMTKTTVGTPLTNAPELLQFKPYGFEADIWSIGVVYYRMLFGDYPFKASDQQAILNQIKSKPPDYSRQDKKISKQSIDFIRRCLTYDPKQRMSWKQIYRHPLITGMSLSKMRQMERSRTLIDENIMLFTEFYEHTELKQQNIQIEEDLVKSILRIDVENEVNGNEDKDGYGNNGNGYINGNGNRDKHKGQDKNGFKKKDQDQVSERFEELYLGRRDDVMFHTKFVEPLLPKVAWIAANHHIAGFILAKKCLADLRKYYDSMRQKKSIFTNQPNFDKFARTQNYQRLLQLLQQDIKNVSKLCQTHKSQIKLTSQEIQAETTSESLKSTNYDNLMKSIINQYVKILAEHVQGCRPEAKRDLMLLMEALEYLGKSQKVYSLEFQRMVSGGDFQKKVEGRRSLYRYSF